MNLRNTLLILLVCSFLQPQSQLLAKPNAQETPFEILFAEHHFSPQTLVVPAGQPLVLTVVNSSHERIEFESFKLNREKVVGPGETITVHLPALRAGSYDFFDDFHPDVPEGEIVAK
jgi:hypothetical protein